MITNVQLDMIKNLSKNNEVNKTAKSSKDNNESKSFDKVLKNEKTNASTSKTLTSKASNLKETATSNDEEIEVSELEDKLKDMPLEDILSCLSMLVKMLDEVKASENGQEVIETKNLLVSVIESSGINDKVKKLAELVNVQMPTNLEVSQDKVSTDAVNTLTKLFDALNTDVVVKSLSKDDLTVVQSLLKELGVKLNKNAEIPAPLNLKNQQEKKSVDEILIDLVSKADEAVTGLLESNQREEVSKLIVKDKVQPKIEGMAQIVNQPIEEPKENLTNQNSKSDSELSKSLEKEEKVLNSILGDEDDTMATKFSLINNSITSKKVETKVEAPIIEKATMVNDVVKNVKYMVNNGVKELVVKINPKDLGEIAIRIVQEEGVMKANLKASSKETYSILSQNLGDIKKYLGEQNIKIQNVDISLYEDTTYYKEEFSNNPFNKEGRENNKNNSNNTINTFDDEDVDQSTESEILSNINMLA